MMKISWIKYDTLGIKGLTIVTTVTFANFTDVPLVRYQLVPIWNVATLIQKASNIKGLPSTHLQRW